jgi:hypothetical protein
MKETIVLGMPVCDARGRVLDRVQLLFCLIHTHPTVLIAVNGLNQIHSAFH